LFAAPSHPYTRGLLNAIPRVDQDEDRLRTIPGVPPNMMDMPPGCPFAPRCDFMKEDCTKSPRPLETFAPERARACTRPVEELV
jgi:oligopeptide transport system ATP-binding protein